MTTRTTWLGMGALALALAGCGGQKGAADEFAAATPDLDGLTLEIQGGPAEGLSASLDSLAVAPATTTPSDGDDLATARARVKALNQALRTFVGNLAEVVKERGVPAIGDRMRYGPADRCVVLAADGVTCEAKATFLLGVKRERAHVFSFLLEARPTTSTSDADYQGVAVGWLARGRAEHRGVGQVGLDLHHLAAVQPLFTGDGFLLAGFTNGPFVKSVHYRLVDFKAPGDTEAVTAAFVGFRNAAGVTRVRVATTADLLAGPNGPELLLAHAAWLPGVGGRAYAIVTNWERLDWTASPPVLVGPPSGDVPVTSTWNDHYWFGRACYTPGASGPVLAFKEWFYCARPGGPAVCVAADPGAGTVVVGSGTWAGNCTIAGAPVELDPPADAADQPQGSDMEPGQSSMTPPVPPAAPGEVTTPTTDPMTM